MAGLPLAAWIGIGVVAAVGIVAGALLLAPDDDPQVTIGAPATTGATATPTPGTPTSEPSTTSSGAGATSVPATTPTSTPTSGPDTTAATAPDTRPTRPELGDGATPDTPLPAGDPDASTFGYAAYDARWQGTIVGLLETDLYWDDEDDARCFVVLGTLTPAQAVGLVSESWATPPVTLFADGEEAPLGDQPCDTDAVTDAGYRALYDVNATVGTDVPFYAEFSLPADAPDPQAIAVGQTDTDWLFFDATLLAAVPPVQPGAVGPLPVEPAPIAAGAPGPFTHTDELTGDEWTGTITGLVDVPLDQYSDIDGTCYAVVGSLTASSVGSGLVTSAYGAPPIALIAAGLLVDDYSGCAVDTIEAAGYTWYNDTEITAGTTLAVYATLLVPEPFPGDLQAIVVGDPWGPIPAVLAPFVLDELPAASYTPGPAPSVTLAAPGTPITVDLDYEDATWDVVVHGHVRAGDCVVVLARATLTAGDGPATPPELFVLAGGRLQAEAFDCDTTAVVNAGYLQQWEAEAPRAGAGVSTYAAFRVPPEAGPLQAIVVSRLALGTPTAIQPTELGSIPPVPR